MIGFGKTDGREAREPRCAILHGFCSSAASTASTVTGKLAEQRQPEQPRFVRSASSFLSLDASCADLCKASDRSKRHRCNQPAQEVTATRT